MKANHLLSWLRLGAVCALVGMAGPADATDSSVIRLSLQNTGADPDAAGSWLSALSLKSSLVSVQASKLTPGANYTLAVGEIPEGTLVANAHGRIAATFTTPQLKGTRALDFDPRGQWVTLSEGTNVVLAAVVSGPGEPSGITVNERAKLARLVGTGEATATYSALASGRRLFTVKIERVLGTNWSLFVNGIWRGPIPVRQRQGSVIFDSSPSTSIRRLLDFDPRGQVIDVAQGTNLMFSGTLAAKAKNVNVASASVRLAFIPSTGVDPNDTARVRANIASDARRKFSVELENVAVGSYEFFANGGFQGMIHVASTPDGTEGEIEFSSREDNGDELPLTFDPSASTYIVQKEGVVFFQGTLSASATTGSTGTPGGNPTEAPVLQSEQLASTGLDSDAEGEAKYEIDDRGRRKFSVEIEDVAAGAYELWIGGVRRGTITAALKSNRVKGEVEFASPNDDGKKLSLNFDPHGQLIEVKTAAGIFFSHVFGTGTGGAGGSNGLGGTSPVVVVPLSLEVPLFNLGVSPNASAKAEFKSDERGRRSFEVEIEDAPAGDYALYVSGSLRSTVSVVPTARGTRGQVEFESEPHAGQPMLDFDPLGQDVAIARDGVIQFRRIFPPGN